MGIDVFVGTTNRLGCPASDYIYDGSPRTQSKKVFSPKRTTDTRHPPGGPVGKRSGCTSLPGPEYANRGRATIEISNETRDTRQMTLDETVLQKPRVSEAKSVYIRVLTRHYFNTVLTAGKTLPKRSGNDSKTP